jgi:hypothetical protein
VADLQQPKPGMLAVKDIDLVAARIRPVLVITGLPEIPLGVFVITSASEDWSSTGRTYELELRGKTSVLDQDAIDASLTVDASKPVLAWVRQVIASAGESIAIDSTQNGTVANPLTWEAGTTKLSIVNDLLDMILFNSLQMSGVGAFLATPYARPAVRPIRYEMLDLDRELIDGPTSVYHPEWTADIDNYSVPNKVIAVSSGTDEEPALSGVAVNNDPSSPYSFQRRGRWITSTLSGVEVPDGSDTDKITALEAKARRSLIASSSPQASVQVKHLPLPIQIGDVIRFASTPASIDSRYVVVNMQLDCVATGLMTSTLQEVIDL